MYALLLLFPVAVYIAFACPSGIAVVCGSVCFQTNLLPGLPIYGDCFTPVRRSFFNTVKPPYSPV